jgi:hypothetical protein
VVEPSIDGFSGDSPTCGGVADERGAAEEPGHPARGEPVSTITARADAAMYQAKLDTENDVIRITPTE